MELDKIQIEEENNDTILRWGSYTRRVNNLDENNDEIISSTKEELASRDEERRLDSAKREVSEGIEDVEPLR